MNIPPLKITVLRTSDAPSRIRVGASRSHIKPGIGPFRPASALTKEADYSIIHGFEANYAAKLEKMGYVMALALELLQQTEGYDKYEQMLAGFDKIFELAENSAQSAWKAPRSSPPSVPTPR